MYSREVRSIIVHATSPTGHSAQPRIWAITCGRVRSVIEIDTHGFRVRLRVLRDLGEVMKAIPITLQPTTTGTPTAAQDR